MAHVLTACVVPFHADVAVWRSGGPPPLTVADLGLGLHPLKRSRSFSSAQSLASQPDLIVDAAGDDAALMAGACSLFGFSTASLSSLPADLPLALTRVLLVRSLWSRQGALFSAQNGRLAPAGAYPLCTRPIRGVALRVMF